MTTRRQLLGAALLGTLSLSGCGFRLRGSFNLPFKTLFLQIPANTPMSTLIRQEIAAQSTVTIVDDPSEAEAILEYLGQSRSRDVLSINDLGRAREYELTLSLEFRVTSPDGYLYMPSTRLSTTRSLSYAESEFLSRSREEGFLYRDMEADLVNRLMRHIEAIKPRSESGE